jgi:hypothetical protein
MDERPDESPALPSAPASGTTDPAVAELDGEVVRRHSSVRLCAVQGGVVLLVVLVVVGLLLHSIGPSQQGTAVVLPTPVPPAVVIASDVNFGAVTLNGKVLPGAPPLATRTFHHGLNVVTLTAPPFGRRTCRFDWEGPQPTAEDGCYTNLGYYTYLIDGMEVTPPFSVSIDLDSTHLPSDLAASAGAVAWRAISAVHAPTMVPAGQYYATGTDSQGHISARRATTSLQADLVFAASARASGFCRVELVCAGADFEQRIATAAGQRLWSVFADVTVAWHYTAAGGTVTSSSDLPLASPASLLLAYDGGGGWTFESALLSAALQEPQLAYQLTAEVCPTGWNLVITVLGQNGLSRNSYTIATQNDHGAAGCEIQVEGLNGINDKSTFLWRFGVLLAVDRGAHMLAPWLPIAPQAEVVAVEG